MTPGNSGLANSNSFIRFQNNIQSIFTRIRLLYGSTPLEDVINYNVIARMLTEWTSSSGQVADQTSIADGTGGIVAISPTVNSSVRSLLHGRYSLGPTNIDYPLGASLTRRYQVTLGLGLLTQGKLLPTKFMASQLAVELTLARPEDCIFGCGQPGVAAVAATFSGTTYSVLNVNMIPEILEFDSSYDNMFLKGLQEGGVPIKFSSWHTYQFSHGGSANANILIQERSRSVKSIFTVIRRQTSTILNDSGALFSNLASTHSLESYQYRIGGRYFPASPVQVGTGAGINTGGAEAFLELQKALHTVGDSRLSTNASMVNWNRPYTAAIGGAATSVNESDGSFYTTTDGLTPFYVAAGDPVAQAYGVPISARGSDAFCFSTCLETTSGMEISGLNAEEQSDISLNIKWNTSGGGSDFMIETYVFYDAMIVLRENNVITLITSGFGAYSVNLIKYVLIQLWILLKLKLTRHLRQDQVLVSRHWIPL